MLAKGKLIRYFVFFTPGYRGGSIHWSNSDSPRIETTEMSVPLHQVEKLSLMTRYNNQSLTSGVDFSLTTKQGSEVIFLAESTEAAMRWVEGLKHVLVNDCQRSVNLLKKDRSSLLYTVQEEKEGDSSGAAATFLDVESRRCAVKLSEGGVFYGYFEIPGPVVQSVRQPINLFYRRNKDSPHLPGVMYWSSKGEYHMHPQQSIRLDDLYQVKLGKQQVGFFKSAQAAAIQGNKCFTLMGSRVALNLEADSIDFLQSWLLGLYSVLEGSGRKVYLESENDTDATNPCRSFSIFSPNDSLMSQSTIASSSTHLSTYPADVVQEKLRAMQHGIDVTTYHAVNNIPEKVRQRLFYSEANNRPAVCWSHPGNNTFHPSQCLPLDMITDIFTGKQTSIFKTKVAAQAHEDHCFSIRGKGGETLNIQMDSEKLRAGWIQGLMYLLPKHGSRMYEENLRR